MKDTLSFITLLIVLFYSETTCGQTTGRVLVPFLPGDPRACLDVARKNNLPLRRLSALPGIGWDNLRNVPTGQVMDYRYYKCRCTEDGRYLTPDDIFTIPIKSSLVQTYAEIFESWDNFTSTTSKSINANAGFNFGPMSISGSYSNEHVRMKSKQILNKAVTTRVQLRYSRYKVRLQPDGALHPAFKDRLVSIAADLNENFTQSAQYKSQLLVRDFGSHVLTSVVAGASLAKTDFVRRNYVESHTSDKRDIKASASASFAHIFSFGATYKSSTDVKTDATYDMNVASSYITSHGGPILRPFNMTVSQWVDGVDMDLVPVDRAGDPLSFLVTEHNFPNMPALLRDSLEKYVRTAIMQYYEMNTVRGCTKRGAPNFSFSANFDDGNCVKARMNSSFGGVYQTCNVHGDYLSANPCTGLDVVNPLTKGYSCPAAYTPVHLNSGTKLGKRESSKHCRRCGFLWLKKCCHYNYHQATAQYDTFWCAALSSVPEVSGYLFGGIYSSTSTNIVTGTKKCPPKFFARQILQEHFICLSEDFELGGPTSVPFGGFSSCTMGNPLAIPPEGTSGTSREKVATWPKRCPRGYSQHMVALDDGCAIRSCIQTGALSGIGNIPIKRPPYSSRPETIRRPDVYLIINSMANNAFRGGRRIVSQMAYDQAMSVIVNDAEMPTTGATHLVFAVPITTVIGIVLTYIC